jgi:hypothetical protein
LNLSACSLLSLLFLWSSGLAAQDPVLTVSADPGLAIPFGDFSSGTGPGEGVGSGASLGATFTLHGTGWRSWYVGFSQRRFSCEDAGCSAGDDYRATGFNAGVLGVLERGQAVQPFFKLGAVTTRVETRSLPAPDGGVSDLGFGGEAGVGVALMPQSLVAVTPSVTVTTINSTLPGGESLQMRYLTASLAIVFRF